MTRILTKKWIAVAAGLTIAASAAIAAYAYFSTDGAGSGTATVGTTSALVLHGTTTGTLYPGATGSVSFTIDNPGSGSERLGTIYLAGVKACTGASSTWDPVGVACSNGGTEATGCETVDDGNTSDANASDFYMADVAENQDIAAGASGTGATNGGTLELNNLGTNQDACKSAALYLQLATR